jgi:hypothetical protein
VNSIARATEAQREVQKLWDDAVVEMRAFISDEIEKATGRRNGRLARRLAVGIAFREMTAATE